MASSCISNLYSLRNPYFSRPKLRRRIQATSQSFPDDVDGKMSVLRRRMEEVRMRERLRRRFDFRHGWNYRSGYDVVQKRHNIILISLQLITIVATSITLVFLTASLCIFLLSLIFSSSSSSSTS